MLASSVLVFALFASAQSGDSGRTTQSASRGDSSGTTAVVPARALAARAPTAALAVRTSAPPKIDGADDESVWQQTPLIDGFLEQLPNEGGLPRLPTTARVLYDADNLYVFVRAFDPHRDSIVARLSRRDGDNTSDRVGLYIDSYHDRRTAYHFVVNAAGVKSDGFFYDDIQQDLGWDGIWDVATRVDSLGWTAEFRVPFSQMRFPRGTRHTFGFAIRRVVARYGDLSGWPLIRPSKVGTVSQMGDLTGIDVPGPAHPVEVAPYTVVKSEPRVPGAALGQRSNLSLGADARIGIAPNVTATLAVNPDFGQVEADPAVLNLTAFETFYPERRPFFLEGQGVFAFSLSRVDPYSDALFYSRRIGRAPQLLDFFGDASSSAETRIWGAAKATGRTSGGASFGILGAQTARVTGTADPDTHDLRTTEPASQYVAARLQQDIHDGRSGLGVMATGVHRSLDAWTSDLLRRDALTAGIDGRHRFLNDTYILSGFFAASRVSGTSAAIRRTQLSSTHNFQRPGAAMPLDPDRTELSGTSGEASFTKAKGVLQFVSNYRRISPGFESNDIGFLGRADFQSWTNFVGLNSTRATRLYQFAYLNGFLYREWTSDGLPTETQTNLSGGITLPSLWTVAPFVTLGQLHGTYCTGCARGGPAVRRDPRFAVGISIAGDTRHSVVPRLDARWIRDEQGRTKITSVSPGVDLRSGARVLWSLGVTATRNGNNAQWYGNVSDAGGVVHYLFARLDQTTLGVANRLNITVTPTTSFEWYAEPFVSVGTFSDVRELGDPTAQRYELRYRPFTPPSGTAGPAGLHFRQFRSNMVFRWEYRSGSVLYLVWNQGRDYFDNESGEFAAGQEERSLFRTRPANTLLVKASYWLNR